MVRHHTRLFTTVLGALVLSLGMITGPASAQASPAARGAFTVGTCARNALPDLPAAVAAVNALPRAQHKTITLCPGTFQVSSPLAITTDNLRVQGRKGTVITTPGGYADYVFLVDHGANVTLQNMTIRLGDGYNTVAVFCDECSNATFRNMVIDGRSALGDSDPVAIVLVGSGRIMNNHILNWQSPAFFTLVTAISAGSDHDQSAQITGNVISNFEGIGMSLGGLHNVVVSGNTMIPTPLVDNSTLVVNGILAGPLQGGRISGNTMTAQAFPNFTDSRGIEIRAANDLTISGNRLEHWNIGILMEGPCTTGINRNHVSRNTILETRTGLRLDSASFGTCNVQADGNTITGNRIIDTAAQGFAGIEIETDSQGGFTGTELDEVVTDNTIVHFATGLSSPLPDPINHITGVFAPNTIRP